MRYRLAIYTIPSFSHPLGNARTRRGPRFIPLPFEGRCRSPSFNGYCITQDNDLPLRPHSSPLSLPFHLSAASPINTPPQRTANNRALLPTRAASGPGYVYTLARSQPTATRAPSRGIGYPVRTNHTRGYHRTERPCRVHGFTVKTRRLFCDGPPYGSMYSGQGDGVGKFVRVLVEGGVEVAELRASRMSVLRACWVLVLVVRRGKSWRGTVRPSSPSPWPPVLLLRELPRSLPSASEAAH